MYRGESVLFLCTRPISDEPDRTCSVWVQITHFCCTVWKFFCFCPQKTFLMYRVECALFLCTVCNSNVKPEKCFFSAHSTYLWRTVWKEFCFCANYICVFLMYLVQSVLFCIQNTFLMYHMECDLFVCTVHISDLPSGKCSVTLHISHSWSIVMWYFFT